MPATGGIPRGSALRFPAAVLVALLLGLTWGGGAGVIEATHTPGVVTKIAVGTSPLGVAVNPVTNKIYVANFSTDNVSVIDGSTNTVLTTVVVGDGSRRLSVNPATNRIYVSNYLGNTISVINGATDSVIATIPVAASPTVSAVNTVTNKVYVGHQDSTLTVISGASNTVLTTVAVGLDPGEGVAVNELTNRVYTSNSNTDDVSVVDGSTDTEIDTDGNSGNGMTRISVGHDPLGLVVDATTNRIYVPIWNSFSGTVVTVIDGATNAIIANATVGSGPTYAGLLPAINRLFTASDSGAVSVVDTKTNIMTDSIFTGSSSRGVAANPTTMLVYVSFHTLNQVWVLRIPTHPLGASLVNFQGRLTDSSGNPVANGNYSLTFRIYDAPTGGNLKWFETQSVAVSGSVFSVLLGSVNPLEAAHFDGEPRHLEVQVTSDPPLSPRQRFTSVPYAFNAQSIDGVGLGDLMARDGVVLHIAAAQTCPTGFSLLMDVVAGVNGTDASRACSSTTYTQVFYIGSTETCPLGWTQADINAAVNGTAAADACYR